MAVVHEPDGEFQEMAEILGEKGTMGDSGMKIVLVRHGESEANLYLNRGEALPVADHAVNLTERGIEQAREAGAYLRDHFIPQNRSERIRVWSSPYTRTRQTANHIMDVVGKENLSGGYREHISLCEQQFGLFDGIPDDQIPIKFPAEHAHYKMCEEHGGRFWARMPLGESRFDVAVRVHESFGTFHRDAERHGIRTIIVVCHGVTMRAFLMQWLHHTPEWFDAEPNPKNCAIRYIYHGIDKGYLFLPQNS